MRLTLTAPFSNQNIGGIKINMASLLNQYSLIFKQHLIKHTSSLKKPVPDVLDSKRGEVPWRMTRTEFGSLGMSRYRYIDDILL